MYRILVAIHPDYIKIDVDETERLFLKGGIQDLKAVRSILIEVNDEFNGQPY